MKMVNDYLDFLFLLEKNEKQDRHQQQETFDAARCCGSSEMEEPETALPMTSQDRLRVPRIQNKALTQIPESRDLEICTVVLEYIQFY
jgi:hypothetical protein